MLVDPKTFLASLPDDVRAVLRDLQRERQATVFALRSQRIVTRAARFLHAYGLPHDAPAHIVAQMLETA